jgi:GntR family transcriptional regulator / MocR family aminotransferase
MRSARPHRSPMARWEYPVPVDRASDVPIYVQIARSLADDIRRGRLRPGDRLPGTRALATGLGVNRNTIVAAYRELDAEGWVSGSEASGTFVSSALPGDVPRAFGVLRREVPPRAGFDLAPSPEHALGPVFRRGNLDFGSGTPDVRLLPVTSIARAYRRAMDANGRRVLDYQTCGRSAVELEDGSYGSRDLRRTLAEMLAATRGLAASWENVIVTRGSQMGLLLTAYALLEPGDVVAVEDMGSRPVHAALRQAGAVLVPIAVDGEGIDVEAVRELAERTPRLKAVYFTPHHQCPTTVTLGQGRRLALLELARRRRIALLEDDFDHEFHWESQPVLPMASVDTAGIVVYVGSLSKILAPGLRIGYVVAPRPLVDRLAILRQIADLQGDLIGEVAVADLLAAGDVARHVRRIRRIYRDRRDLLTTALRKEVGGALSFDVPTGGLAIWARVADDLDAERWSALAIEEGVSFRTARFYTVDGSARPFLRLGFSGLDEPELLEAVRRLARAHRRLASVSRFEAPLAAAGR